MLVFVAIVAAIAYAAYRAGAAIDRRRRARYATLSRTTGAGTARRRRRTIGDAASRDAPPAAPLATPTAAPLATPPAPPLATPPEPGTLDAVFARIDALLRGER